MLAHRSAALLISLSLLAGCNRKEPPKPDHPRLTPNVLLREVTLHSAALDRDMPYRVILPASAPIGTKLPAVYLLHGGGGDYRDWSNYSDVAHFAEDGLILVMPEGHSSYYANAAGRPQDRYEDYIAHDLIADVESRFAVASDRQHRAIVGISMGGFGAVNLAFHHPELFAFSAAMSPAIDVPSRPLSFKRISQYRHHSSIFGAWGSDTRRRNDPFVFVRTADPEQAPYLFLTCGDQEGLLPANRRFAGLLAERHFHYEFHTVPGGHDWNQWNARLADVFRALEAHLARPIPVSVK